MEGKCRVLTSGLLKVDARAWWADGVETVTSWSLIQDEIRLEGAAGIGDGRCGHCRFHGLVSCPHLQLQRLDPRPEFGVSQCFDSW